MKTYLKQIVRKGLSKLVGAEDLPRLLNDLKHLSETFVFSVDGFPMKMPWILRKTIGRIIMRQVLRSNEMKEGIKVPDRFIPEPGADSRAEAEALRGAIKLFSAHPGPFAEHPFFGTMTRDQWDHLHRIHCAHHLSFAQPSGLA